MLDVNSSNVKFEVTLDKVLNNNLKTRYLTVNQYSSVIQYLTVSVYDIYSCETITLTFSFSISNDNSIAIVDFLYIFPIVVVVVVVVDAIHKTRTKTT